MIDITLSDLISVISKRAFKSLSKRHAVNVKYLVGSAVEEQFTKCIEIAMKAFLDRIKAPKSVGPEYIDFFMKYLNSNKISEEISRLLDPGIEIFDMDFLVSHFEEMASAGGFTHYDHKNIKKAWDEFSRAFSFASRSTPELREFLRASYEAGSFRAISNIDDALENIGHTLGAVNAEENKLKKLISVFSDDLLHFRNWASKFSYSY